jgi:hypothetical protein
MSHHAGLKVGLAKLGDPRCGGHLDPVAKRVVLIGVRFLLLEVGSVTGDTRRGRSPYTGQFSLR